MKPQLILHHGKITTLMRDTPEVTALAITDGNVTAVGNDATILPLAGDQTQKIDLNNRRVIPGLNDSHLHVIRAGLNYLLELRWDGVTSLRQALTMLRLQAENTPKGQWVRVIGGWTGEQSAEKPPPNIAELNAVAPDVPVFILPLS